MIQSFESFNEEKKDKWIQDAIKNPGSLRKSFKKKKGEKISIGEIDSELQALKGRDKDRKKPGTQLGKRDATKYKRLNLAKTLKSLKESQENDNYMFFSNLKTIKRLVDEMLEMDESSIDQMLSQGHNWAADHIATSKDDIEEVFNFLEGNKDENLSTDLNHHNKETSIWHGISTQQGEPPNL